MKRLKIIVLRLNETWFIRKNRIYKDEVKFLENSGNEKYENNLSIINGNSFSRIIEDVRPVSGKLLQAKVVNRKMNYEHMGKALKKQGKTAQ